MTRNQNIEMIRTKCVAANPEIVGYSTHEVHDPISKEITSTYKTYDGSRPIRLTDVLVAIEEESKARGLPSEEDGGGTSNTQINSQTWRDRRWVETVYAWNLRQDDLTAQSDACIQFLCELLS